MLLGTFAADSAQVGPVELEPVITLDGRTYRVAGIITKSDREVDLLSAAVFDITQTEPIGTPFEIRRLLTTQAGAAPQVAQQAPLVVHPAAPQDVEVIAPVDPQRLRAGIQSDMRLILLVLTAVALLASIVALTNAMVLAVVERAAEYGLRRALGARPRHIRGQRPDRIGLIGLAGGIAGLTVGIGGILAVTLANRWVPVFDLRLAPIAIGRGIVVAALAGIVAAMRAARIQPADALRAR